MEILQCEEPMHRKRPLRNEWLEDTFGTDECDIDYAPQSLSTLTDKLTVRKGGRNWHLDPAETGRAHLILEWAFRLVQSHSQEQSLHQEFRKLCTEWRDQTGHFSSIERKVLHPAYQRIIGLGRPAVPLVLEELRDRRGLWFWALHHMTGEDPAAQAKTIDEARSLWLSWGKKNRYISRDE